MKQLDRAWRMNLADEDAPDFLLDLFYPVLPSPDARRIARARIAINDTFRTINDGREEPVNITPLAEDPGDEFSSSAARNFNKAFELSGLKLRRLSAAFSGMVAKIAEDLAGWPVPGDDEWNPGLLIERRLNRHPLHTCMQGLERRALVLVLDSSGSCLPQARFYSRIAAAAADMGDVEMYDAPNAGIRARRRRRGWESVPKKEWNFIRRTVVFLGDFDGGDAVVEASRKNRVYWFSSESRYPSMKLHPWCTHTLADFRGQYYTCMNEDDFIRLMKKVK